MVVIFAQENSIYKSNLLRKVIMDLFKKEEVIVTYPESIHIFKNEKKCILIVDCVDASLYYDKISEINCKTICAVSLVNPKLLNLIRENFYFLVKPFDNLEESIIKYWLMKCLLNEYPLKPNLKKYPKSFLINHARIYEGSYQNYDHEHPIRVGKLAYLLAHKYGLSKEECDELLCFATIHDIGKMFIPLGILYKPGILSYGEFEIIKTHIYKGYEICKFFFDGQANPEISKTVLTHHKNFNKTGYPEEVKESSIYNDIVKVADVFDAITNERSYKEIYSIEKAISFIKENTGTMFNPQIVEILLSVIK